MERSDLRSLYAACSLRICDGGWTGEGHPHIRESKLSFDLYFLLQSSQTLVPEEVALVTGRWSHGRSTWSRESTDHLRGILVPHDGITKGGHTEGCGWIRGFGLGSVEKRARKEETKTVPECLSAWGHTPVSPARFGSCSWLPSSPVPRLRSLLLLLLCLHPDRFNAAFYKSSLLVTRFLGLSSLLSSNRRSLPSCPLLSIPNLRGSHP